jgi:hypothetical protein
MRRSDGRRAGLAEAVDIAEPVRAADLLSSHLFYVGQRGQRQGPDQTAGDGSAPDRHVPEETEPRSSSERP